jgi:hypothetical protein
MAVAALVWLGYEFGRLLFDLAPKAGVDLHLRTREVHAWFKGEPVYGAIWTAVYPPASYPFLWLLTGWLEFAHARWLYAFLAVAAVTWMVWLLIRTSGADSRTERALIGLIPLSAYATGATIGNAQLIMK